jgi:CubicO group peptidase (beta-lactamase class C family)
MGTGAAQVHPPGELFSYCNAGHCVLGALVAKLRGGTWESVLRERLIGPLGVMHMALFAEEAILFRASVGHLTEPDGDPPHIFSKWQMPRSNAPAGATPCAAPRELVRFGRMFLADGVAEDGTRVLPAGTLLRTGQSRVAFLGSGAALSAGRRPDAAAGPVGAGILRFGLRSPGNPTRSLAP